MFEKVNPGHPDKMADRLAGAVVDLVRNQGDRSMIAL
jgi:S-adenosylmethionine synthetase